MPHPMHMPLPMPLPRSNGPAPLPHQQNSQWNRRNHENTNQISPSSNDASKSHVNEKRQTFAAENYDDYNGLMSTKEKQWLMSIQINQLISDNPYVEDYYFTVLRLRCLGKLPGRDSNEGPKLIMHDRAKVESRTYAPTQFANSLGKLQVVTYTAPRRIIDVTISQSTPEMGQDPQVAVKDMRKFKQILLDIEKMYVWLLDLEDAEMRVESLPKDTEPGPHHQATIEYQHKLQSFLSAGDRLQQIMLVRKGKVQIFFFWLKYLS
jgi:DNA topoisomerase 2-associated protein PAT1